MGEVFFSSLTQVVSQVIRKFIFNAYKNVIDVSLKMGIVRELK